jgi:WD domain, G-beta repeat
VPAEHHEHAAFGDDGLEDKETWRVKNMSRALGTEIYDLAWSPDGTFIISGSMDNIARIYNAQTGIVWLIWVMLGILTYQREHCQTDCRAQPFRPRRCMGPSERICSNSILGPIRSHIHSQDKGRSIRAAQQSFKNGPPIAADFVEQPSTSRLRSRLICSRKHISRHRITNSVSSWNTAKSCTANESTSYLT